MVSRKRRSNKTGAEVKDDTDGSVSAVAQEPSLRRSSRRAVGNQDLQRLINDGSIQPKLEVSAPGDRCEREADRMAESVMGMSEPAVADERPIGEAGSASAQRMCSRCQRRYRRGKPLCCKECEEKLHRRKAVDGARGRDAGLRGRIESARTGGRPLPESVRSFFEPRFGTDFSDVRVHTDTRADAAARSINAEAFTIGNDIVFRSDAYAPQSHDGQQLMAHELAHVVQQRGSSDYRRGRPSGQTVDRPDIQRQAASGSVSVGAVLAWCLSGAGISAAVDAVVQFVGGFIEGIVTYNYCRGIFSALFGCVFGMVGGAVAAQLAREVGEVTLAQLSAWVIRKLKVAGYKYIAGQWGVMIAKLGCEGSETVTLWDLERDAWTWDDIPFFSQTLDEGPGAYGGRGDWNEETRQYNLPAGFREE